MALIHLNYISKLAKEGRLAGAMVQRALFNWKSEDTPFSDQEIAYCLKIQKQSRNLYDQLKKLHQICFDLAASNHAPYIAEWQSYLNENEQEPYDPFWFLLNLFQSDFSEDLPPDINQYAELVALSTIYAKLQGPRADWLPGFLAGLTKSYLIRDKAGNQVLVPESEIPRDVLDQWAVQRDIDRIETEYCLDGYNEFYQRSLEAIERYRQTSEPVTCAQFILSLFAPVPTAKLREIQPEL